jgi:hypothetical protein
VARGKISLQKPFKGDNRTPEPCRQKSSFAVEIHARPELTMPILLWLLGVPISVIILLMLFGFLR